MVSRALGGSPIVWVRLQHGRRSIDAPVGEHVVGRGPECAICIDAPLASRRHAAIVVAPEGVTVRDLGSRNGVLVNGVRLSAPRELAQGGIVSVGGQTIGVVAIQRGRALPIPSAPGRRETLGEVDLADAFNVATTLSHVSSGPEKRIEAFRVLGELASSALAAGDAPRAEALLERALAEVLSTVRGRIAIQPELVHFAGDYALRLAQAANKPYWLDYVFDLYTTHSSVMPADLVERLEGVFEEVAPSDLATVKAYADAINREPPGSHELQAVRTRIAGLAARLGPPAPATHAPRRRSP